MPSAHNGGHTAGHNSSLPEEDICEECRWNDHHAQLRGEREKERREMENEEVEAVKEYYEREGEMDKSMYTNDSHQKKQLQLNILSMNRHLMASKEERDLSNSATDYVFATRASTADRKRAQVRSRQLELGDQIEENQRSARHNVDDTLTYSDRHKDVHTVVYTDRELDLLRRGIPIENPSLLSERRDRNDLTQFANDGRQMEFDNENGASEQRTERRRRGVEHRHALEAQIAANRRASDHKLMGKPWFVDSLRKDADFKDRTSVVITNQATRVAKQHRSLHNLETFLAADAEAKRQHHLDLLDRRDIIRLEAAEELETKEREHRERVSEERRARETQRRRVGEISGIKLSPRPMVYNREVEVEENGDTRYLTTPNPHFTASSPMAVRRRRASEGHSNNHSAHKPCSHRKCRKCHREIRRPSIDHSQAYWLGGVTNGRGGGMAVQNRVQNGVQNGVQEYSVYAPYNAVKPKSRYV